MNFLSHFYFDRTSTNCYHILGTVLPDLLKNADKAIVLHPEKLQHPDQKISSLIEGWKKHLEVDRHFHSSKFFLNHSHRLRLLLTPAIEGSPVKPFFLGHIAVELILDNLLLTNHKVTVDDFYNHLDACDEEVIHRFLIYSGLQDTQTFFKFFKDFKAHRYLHTYKETLQIAYALKRICMRVWNNPFNPQQETAMNEVLAQYRELLQTDYMLIFEEIAPKLSA
jgi:hypothetical protein